jgi:hypothetical protein
MGLLDATVSTNGFANVITEGLLSGLDTSTATVGDPIWLGTSGNLTYGLASKPVAPAHLVFIGIVTRAHATQGEIFVRPQNGFEIDELHNVLATSPTNGDLLIYNSSTGLWTKAAQSTLAIANTQVSGLGTASTKDVPATGDASTSQVVYGTDTRLTNSRTPTTHASTHGSGGSDAITIAESQVTNLTTDLAAKAALTADQTFTGSQTIQASADANKPLIVKAFSGTQSANLQEWQSSAGAILSRIASNGAIISTTSISATGNFTNSFGGAVVAGQIVTVNTASASNIGLAVKGAASQKADSLQYQTSAGAVLGGANAFGQTYTGSTTPLLTAVGGATTATS